MDAASAHLLLSDAHFLLAQILWDPRCDRDRALQIAKLAARTHPDPRKRSSIECWLQVRSYDIPTGLDSPMDASPYLDLSVSLEIEVEINNDIDVTQPCTYIDVEWLSANDQATRPYDRV